MTEAEGVDLGDGPVNELWRSEEACAREHAASNLSLCFEALTDEWA